MMNEIVFVVNQIVRIANKFDCLMNWSVFCLNKSDVICVPEVQSGFLTTYSTHTFA